MMSGSKKVLFICTANLCRSPMAEALFNAMAGDRGLPFTAASVGTRAREGYDMAPYAREALDMIGVRPARHRSRRIAKETLDGADLVLVMGPRHASVAEGILGAGGKTHLLAEYAGEASGEEIPDPYGLTLFAYTASARQLYGYVEKALDRLEREHPA